MSFLHSTIVGHFDPSTLFGRNSLQVTRPVDIEAARALLSEFPEDVASDVVFQEGYVECWWAHQGRSSQANRDYAYRLAEQQNCIAAESPFCLITFPEDAEQQQAAAWQRWREDNPPPEPKPRVRPLFTFPEPGPCPYCGKLLRTSLARQCRFCKMDWHDPQNVRVLVQAK